MFQRASKQEVGKGGWWQVACVLKGEVRENPAWLLPKRDNVLQGPDRKMQVYFITCAGDESACLHLGLVNHLNVKTS